MAVPATARCAESARAFSTAGGTLALAKAGLLDDVAAAAPWQCAAAWQAVAPKVRFAPADWIEGRKFYTCVSGRALVGLLLRCISRHFGAAGAADAARGLKAEIGAAEPSHPGCWSEHGISTCRSRSVISARRQEA